MDLQVSYKLYQEHYKERMSYDMFLGLLEQGLIEEGLATGEMSLSEGVNARRLALEYNIDLMVKLLQE